MYLNSSLFCKLRPVPVKSAMPYRCIILTVLIFSCFRMDGKSKLISSIPFEMSGGYIILKAHINNSSPLYLIFDSGVRNTIITEFHEGDSLSMDIKRKQPIQGLGSGKSIYAFVSDSNRISFKKFSIPNKTIYLLEEDLFGLSQHNGRRINGLLGIDLIQSHIVEIDYSAQRMRFYDREGFEPPKNYAYRPLVIENNKIFLNLTLLDGNAKIKVIKMLIDTGAQLNAWFQTIRENSTAIPEKRVHARIGEGFSGEIFGYLARIPMICLEQFCFRNPIVVFPDSTMITEVMKRSDRDGTIGSELLSRFNVFIDYQGSGFYFKPNGSFKSEFKYNIAGIEVTQNLFPFPRFEVTHVWKDSPADKAGLIPGDAILAINDLSTYQMTIREIRGRFQEKSRMPMRLLVERESNQLVMEVSMRDLLGNP